MLDLFQLAAVKSDRKKIDSLPIPVRFSTRVHTLCDVVEEVELQLNGLRYNHNKNTLTDCLKTLNEQFVVHAIEVILGANSYLLAVKLIDEIEELGTTLESGTKRAAGGGRKKKVDESATADMFEVEGDAI